MVFRKIILRNLKFQFLVAILEQTKENNNKKERKRF